MRIQWFPTWLHRKSSIFLILIFILLLASCSKEEIVVANLEHESTLVVDLNTGKRSEHLFLSFDLLGEERPLQVRIASSNNVSSWIVSVQGQVTSTNTANYQVGPLAMGEGIPLPTGTYDISIINEDGIILREQLKLQAIPKDKLPATLPHYDSETGVISSLPVPSQMHRYDETGRSLATVFLSEASYTVEEEDASLAFLSDGITYLVRR